MSVGSVKAQKVYENLRLQLRLLISANYSVPIEHIHNMEIGACWEETISLNTFREQALQREKDHFTNTYGVPMELLDLLVALNRTIKEIKE